MSSISIDDCESFDIKKPQRQCSKKKIPVAWLGRTNCPINIYIASMQSRKQFIKINFPFQRIFNCQTFIQFNTFKPCGINIIYIKMFFNTFKITFHFNRCYFCRMKK
eukprot:45570_1